MQSLWYRNGGQITHDYLKHIRKTIRQEIFEYLEKLPVNLLKSQAPIERKFAGGKRA